MSYSPLSIKRRNVLGNLYRQCDPVEKIPVYLGDTSNAVGYMTDSPVGYSDAFDFHLPEDICKKLSTGSFSYGLDYDFSPGDKKDAKRIKLNFIVLMENRPDI